MPKNSRFLIGLVAVAGVVTYLVWTGITQTSQFYLTPTELNAKISQDPSFVRSGVKVGARIIPGTYIPPKGSGVHQFQVEDPNDAKVTFKVDYRGDLPDTFTDAPDKIVDAVLEGRFDNQGVFEATTVLTKCGSRYEAAPEQLKAG
jgi:cytochrome c-type biogenesis protein CcmE